jgi:hypothetical protein
MSPQLVARHNVPTRPIVEKEKMQKVDKWIQRMFVTEFSVSADKTQI